MAGHVGLPRWLRGLKEERFIAFCETHVENYKTKLCLYCGISICYHCEPSHHNHRLIQVHPFHFSIALKLDDIKELIDCSLIQTYRFRREIVVLVRPDAWIGENNKPCYTCGKTRPDKYRYCSLACKVDYILLQGNDISNILFQFDASQFTLTESENLEINVDDLFDSEAFDRDQNQITPDIAPVDFVQGEGSSSGWSLSDIVESCKKKQ